MKKWGDHWNKKFFVNKSVKALISLKLGHQGLLKLHVPLRGFSSVGGKWDPKKAPILFKPENINLESYLHKLCFETSGDVRACFRIQEKHPTCSKMASLPDVFLPDWWKLKLLVTIGLNSFSSCTNTHTHIHLYGVLLFLQTLISCCRFWEHLVMVVMEIRDFLLIWVFKNKIVKFTERILKKFCKGLATLIGQRRNAPVLSFLE